MEKIVTLLCGLPACGKSTWRSANVADNCVVISSDDLIEEEARKEGKTYDEVFKDTASWADKTVKETYRTSIQKGLPIVVDRTNLTAKVRRFWIDEAKKNGYDVQAIWFKPPDGASEINEWVYRMTNREGKTIPDNVIKSMAENMSQPTISEGLSVVRGYNTFNFGD